MTTQEFILTRGPTKEQLFDCIRLGASIKELQVVEFWGEYKNQNSKDVSSLLIQIQGVHRDGEDGRSWFFWGQRTQIILGDKRVPLWKSDYVDYCFGKWNLFDRRGIMKLGDTSFFVSPVSGAEFDAINNRIM